MITKYQKKMLHDAHTEFQKARFSLFKAAVCLEDINRSVLEKTINEIKDVIDELYNSSNTILDFIDKGLPEGD